MEKKSKIAIVLLAAGLIVVAAYTWGIQKNFGIQFMNNCKFDYDCTVVAAGFCGGAAAINKNYADSWQQRLEEEASASKDVQCTPTLPLDFYKAKCIDGKCAAVQFRSS